MQDHALIQFATPSASQSALVHLRGFTLQGRSLEISFSKHSFISIRPGSGNEQYAITVNVAVVHIAVSKLIGGRRESSWMREYGHGLNRFTGKYANTTRHIYSPTKILHISNFDEATNEQVMLCVLSHFSFKR